MCIFSSIYYSRYDPYTVKTEKMSTTGVVVLWVIFFKIIILVHLICYSLYHDWIKFFEVLNTFTFLTLSIFILTLDIQQRRLWKKIPPNRCKYNDFISKTVIKYNSWQLFVFYKKTLYWQKISLPFCLQRHKTDSCISSGSSIINITVFYCPLLSETERKKQTASK